MVLSSFSQRELIEKAWSERSTLTPQSHPEPYDAVMRIIDQLDAGQVRIAEPHYGEWHVQTWLKMAVLLYFRLRYNSFYADLSPAYDKVPLKFAHWNESEFQASGIRAVPGSIVRYGAYIAPGVVLMPCFVNIGAYVDEGTMVDSFVTVGSAAQIGKNCHISANVAIGGVLEPLLASPVIIENNCFIGAGSQLTEGVIIEEGAVIGMGVALGSSTPIVNRATGEISYGRIPAYSVVVQGSLPSSESARNAPLLNCAVIVKQVDEKTRTKTSLNELLRP